MIHSFVDGEITAVEFDTKYREQFSQLNIVTEKMFHILEDLAITCDSYVDDPKLRENAEDIDEIALRKSAKTALDKLSTTGV